MRGLRYLCGANLTIIAPTANPLARALQGVMVAGSPAAAALARHTLKARAALEGHGFGP